MQFSSKIFNWSKSCVPLQISQVTHEGKHRSTLSEIFSGFLYRSSQKDHRDGVGGWKLHLGPREPFHLQLWLWQTTSALATQVCFKALQKAKYSKFLCSSKFGTHFSPYFPKIWNLSRHNQIIEISQKKIRNIQNLRNTGFGVKNPCSEYSVHTEYPKMADFWYPKPVQKYCILIKLIFLQKTHSDSNFNWKFRTQGLSLFYDFNTNCNCVFNMWRFDKTVLIVICLNQG